MPIFQDPDRRPVCDLWSTDGPRENDAVENCSFPFQGFSGTEIWETQDVEMHDPPSSGEAPSNFGLPPVQTPTTTRAAIIERIKRRDNYSVCRYFPSHLDAPTPVSDQATSDARQERDERSRDYEQEILASPAEIERPRSALHSGDFREGVAQSQAQAATPVPTSRPADSTPFSSSPTTPWYNTPFFSASSHRQNSMGRFLEHSATTASRCRAPSLGSFSSSYVLKAPTSPLVHQANNTDLDFASQVDTVNIANPIERANRRRTLPPETFRRLQTSPSAPPGSMEFTTHSGLDDRAQSFSYHGHRSRRSLTSYTLQLASSVQTPGPRFRRPSFASEFSGKRLASLVGSYEESILRGRMSMNPSKPLDFTAQIGVLGKGKCNAHLRCPPHVTVPFPAVFYSYPSSGPGRSISDDSPSPYVGLIDVENSLARDNSSASKRRRRLHHNAESGTMPMDDIAPSDRVIASEHDARRRREKRNRRSESPKSPPGGCYRIPQQGQLQIMIKNPNKTAVKLFLVPYDLSDMEPGTKTFIRQRSYSAGPIIDMPLSARRNFGTDRPEASLNPTEDPKDKPVLRYLIHLNICSPSKSRFYLYSSIRVVFANRVPDGKENLRNEIQLPEPRYSPYKPQKDPQTNNAHTRLTTDNAHRRRNGGRGTSTDLSFASMGDSERTADSHPAPPPSRDDAATLPPLPRSMDWFGTESDARRHGGTDDLAWSPTPRLVDATSRPIVPVLQAAASRGSDSLCAQSPDTGMYHKLHKGDVGYGGYRGSGSEAGESLLAKRLRNLDVHKPSESSEWSSPHGGLSDV